MEKSLLQSFIYCGSTSETKLCSGNLRLVLRVVHFLYCLSQVKTLKWTILVSLLFKLHAVRQDSISEHVTQRDLIALEYLENIELVSRSGADGAEFTFRTNPYFSNKFLRRVVGWEDMGGASVPVDEGTSVDWKAGHNLTVKEVAKKSAKVCIQFSGPKYIAVLFTGC